MSTPAPSVEALRALLFESGCAAVGVAAAEPFGGVQADIESRKDEGLHGGMHFTFGDPGRSTDIRISFPWAESLLVAGFAYLPASGSPARALPNHGRVARFATEDHYRPLRAALTWCFSRRDGRI